MKVSSPVEKGKFLAFPWMALLIGLTVYQELLEILQTLESYVQETH